MLPLLFLLAVFAQGRQFRLINQFAKNDANRHWQVLRAFEREDEYRPDRVASLMNEMYSRLGAEDRSGILAWYGGLADDPALGVEDERGRADWRGRWRSRSSGSGTSSSPCRSSSVESTCRPFLAPSQGGSRSSYRRLVFDGPV